MTTRVFSKALSAEQIASDLEDLAIKDEEDEVAASLPADEEDEQDEDDPMDDETSTSSPSTPKKMRTTSAATSIKTTAHHLTSADFSSSFELGQLVFVVGHVAIKHIVYLELVERELKRRKEDKNAQGL